MWRHSLALAPIHFVESVQRHNRTEEDGDVEQFELLLIGDVETDSGEFIIGERLTV